MSTFNDATEVRTYKYGFGKGTLSMDGYSNPAGRSVAELVLETFGIEYIGTGGGVLEGIDMDHMEAISALKMSLLEEFGKGTSAFLLEPIVDADGLVEFVSIGEDAASLDDIYHEIPSRSYVNKDTYVQITGRKLLPVRNIRGWQDVIGLANGRQLWDTEAMVDTCYIPNFKRYSTITFHDPHFNNWSWGDGIDSIYDVKDANEEVMGWAYYLDPGNKVDIETKVRYQASSATVPILIANSSSPGLYNADIGILADRQVHALVGDPELEDCWSNQGSEPAFTNTTGIKVDIDNNIRRFFSVRGTQVDKFSQISKIYVIGKYINNIQSYPISDAVAAEYINFSQPDNLEVWITVTNPEDIVLELSPGTDYAVGFVNAGLNVPDAIRVLFANNADYFDFATYGNGVEYKVSPYCRYFNIKQDGEGTILPLENNRGMLVEQIYAQVEMETPSIVVVDPQGNADEIAADLQFEAAAITITNEPAPIAVNGELIDQLDGKIDSDPTTVQDLSDTHMERVLTEMDSGGNSFKIQMASLDEDETIELSQRVYDYIEEDEGIETTYLCGPSTQVKLGERGLAGGVINNITYSYADSGSYTISVTEGPRVMGGLSGIVGTRYIKAEETISVNGTVMQDVGNHVIYKVRLDGVGMRECINGTIDIIRVGDVVSVTLSNNPVES